MDLPGRPAADLRAAVQSSAVPGGGRWRSLDQGQRLSFEVVRDERISRSCAENLMVSGTLLFHRDETGHRVTTLASLLDWDAPSD